MSTRICVKGLPPRLYNETQLTKKFSDCGVITSVDLPALAKGKSNGVAFVGFKDKDSASKAVKTYDKTYMGTTRIQVEIAQPIQKFSNKRPAPFEDNKKSSKKVKKEEDIQDDDEESTDYISEIKKAQIEKIANNGRLWLQNLAYCCTEENLRELIGDEDTEELRCLFNKKTGDCNGNAYITFTDRDRAVELYKSLDGTEFLGKILKIFPCDDRRELNAAQPTMNLPFVPKSHVDHGTKSWNALFVSGDVVAETFSKKLEIEKSKLLEGSKDLPPPTALALAELRILQDVRQFLLDNNVNIYSFGQGPERSRTTLIAKNLPPDFTQEDVQRTFRPFGTIRRIIFNQDMGLTAILELNESGAKAAFDRINGAMFRGRPIKLEFAPAAIFDKIPDETKVVVKKEEDDDNDESETVEKERSKTIVIRNLPFTIKESELMPLMKAVGEVKEIRIPEDVTGKKRGFCFVEFVDTRDAQKAFQMFEGVHFAGRRMVLELSKVKETVKHGKMIDKKNRRVTQKGLQEAMNAFKQK